MSHVRSIQPIKSGLGLRELQAVLAVAELGSFRRAAAALGYTQSALSHQVSALEAALAQPLFYRPGGRAPVRLTPAGEAVCRRAWRALSEVEAVAADAEQAARGEIVRVRVGVTQTAAAEIMPAALRAFRDDHPGVEVVLTAADDPDSSRAALRRGDLDLAFSYDPEADEYVEAIAVLDDPWVILTRRDSPIASLDHPGFGALDQREPGRLDSPVARSGRARGHLGPARHRTQDRLPHRRQPGPATAGRGRARPRLHRACGGQPGRGPGADLARAARAGSRADDCPVLPAGPPGDRHCPLTYHGHPRAGRLRHGQAA